MDQSIAPGLGFNSRRFHQHHQYLKLLLAWRIFGRVSSTTAYVRAMNGPTNGTGADYAEAIQDNRGET
jgi:hypothetical protein